MWNFSDFLHEVTATSACKIDPDGFSGIQMPQNEDFQILWKTDTHNFPDYFAAGYISVKA